MTTSVAAAPATTNDNDPMDVEEKPHIDDANGVAPKPQNAVAFSRDLLKIYYDRLFPFDLMHQWFSYGSQKTFSHREFSFTIKSPQGDEIYIRYQSFRDKSELSSAICKKCPDKIDIGAVFSHCPVDKSTVPSGSFQPESREVSFRSSSVGCHGTRHH